MRLYLKNSRRIKGVGHGCLASTGPKFKAYCRKKKEREREREKERERERGREEERKGEGERVKEKNK
jgi:hypothetical protein